MSRRTIFCTLATISTVGAALLLFGCGGGSSTTSSTSTAPAMVNLSISDPPTCSAPEGPFSHIYVTITDVQINASASAGDSDPGWIDLTPNLSQNPQQVDLLGQATNQCFLAMLGAATELQPGTYQQIRIILAASGTVSGNQCAANVNCVMLASDPTNTPQPLLLSGESKTGLKIPSGQIAGGQFTIAAGETKDLNLDFDACASIVMEGNGQFRLKPVLHAGEVSLTSSSINGKIVDSATGQPIIGGNTVVTLEQKDANGVDRVVMETVSDSTGAFVFCPVAAGTYDVVAAGINANQVAYAGTIIMGVQPGNALGTVPLTAESGSNQAPGSIAGEITSSTGTAPISIDITLSALQAISVNGSTLLVTIPLAAQSSATATLSTAAATSCPANTDCVLYTLSVPASNPSVGAFSTSGAQTPAPPLSGPVNYTMDALGFISGTGTPDCTQSDLETSSTTTNTPLTVTAGGSVTAATLAFTGCQ